MTYIQIFACLHNYRDKRCKKCTWIVCITYNVLTCDEIGLE